MVPKKQCLKMACVHTPTHVYTDKPAHKKNTHKGCHQSSTKYELLLLQRLWLHMVEFDFPCILRQDIFVGAIMAQ